MLVELQAPGGSAWIDPTQVVAVWDSEHVMAVEDPMLSPDERVVHLCIVSLRTGHQLGVRGPSGDVVATLHAHAAEVGR